MLFGRRRRRGRRRRLHFVSLYSQSTIEFTAELYNAVARKRYCTI